MSRGHKVVISIAEQAVRDTLPVTGWKIFSRVSDTLNHNVELTKSETISKSRVASAGMPTSAAASGDTEVELIKGVYDDYIAAAAGNNWATNKLTFGGDVMRMFAIEKSFGDFGAAGWHHVWGGMRVNTWKLTVPEKGLITMTFGWMGTGYQNAALPFATDVLDTAVEPKASNLNIKDVKIDGVTLKGRSCVTAFTFEANNNMEIKPCLFGGLYGSDILEKMLDMMGTINLSYNPASQELLDKQITGKTISIEAVIQFEGVGTYTLKIPKAQISGDLPAGGKDRLDAALTYNVVGTNDVADLPTLTRVV